MFLCLCCLIINCILNDKNTMIKIQFFYFHHSLKNGTVKSQKERIKCNGGLLLYLTIFVIIQLSCNIIYYMQPYNCHKICNIITSQKVA